MILSTPTLTLTAVCPSCGAAVKVNQHAAKYAAKGVMCADCRRAGNGWQGKAAYAEYLKSYHWQAMRPRALKRAGHKCQVCAAVTSLDVHHNDYSRLGGELMTDLVVLCRRCHELFHGVVS